ncbi:MAG: hypothetical protein WD825_06390 [Gemmatimonadaceae bacterium]
MTFSHRLRRAALLGMAFGVGACDIASFINDPKPIFEQTWNLPADTVKVSVASLLPAGVSIFSTTGSTPPDSSAFQMTGGITGVNFTRRVGDDCAQCVTLNGTNAFKPAFVLATGSTTSLPTDVVSATLTGGTVTLQVTNSLSFDPLMVKTNAPASSDPAQQGRMVIVVRSGSLVVGKDSVNGVTTAFAPGAILTRTIPLQTGNVTSALAFDLTLTSPIGDHNEFINANGTLVSAGSVPDFRVAQVRMNVVNKTMASIAGDSLPLDGIDASITDKVVSAEFAMTITNPFNVTGNLDMQFGFGPLAGETISKTLSLPTGTDQPRSVSLNTAEMQNLFGKKVGLTVSGSVNSTAPIDVTPRQVVIIANRLILKILTGTPVAN